MARLDALLAEVRDADVGIDEGFLSRMESLALSEQPRAPVLALPARAARPGSRGWFSGLGGWPGLGGLAAVTVAGFWIGVASPAGLFGLVGGTETVDLLPGAEFLALVEGGEA